MTRRRPPRLRGAAAAALAGVALIALSRAYRAGWLSAGPPAPVRSEPLDASVREFSGRVVRVRDGDSLKVEVEGSRSVEVRLFGVDAPELRGQPFGRRAKAFSEGLAGGRRVRVLVRATDAYGRSVAVVELPDGRSLNGELLRAGLAWVYRRYTDSAEFLALEAAARQEGRGLWSARAPVAPWRWRRSHPRR